MSKHRHGLTKTKVHHCWRMMKYRCLNKNSKSYKDYGGSGIIICDSWLNFENFLHDMGHPPSEDHSIDRIDGNSGYHKENCRWATKSEQALNRKTRRLITLHDATLHLEQWSRITGINKCTIRRRIARGWNVERALSKR